MKHEAQEQEKTASGTVEPLKGLREGCGYEAILITKDGHGGFNFSAVGFKRTAEQLSLRIFQGSDSYQNIRKNGRFGLGLLSTRELPLLARAALTGWGREGEQEFSESELDIFDNIPFPKTCTAFLICETVELDMVTVTDHVGTSRLLLVTAEPERAQFNERSTDQQFLSRGPSLFLEAMVRFTRLKSFFGTKGPGDATLPEETKIQLQTLEWDLSTLKRLGWHSCYREHWEEMSSLLNVWKSGE